MRYSTEPKNRKYVKGHDFLSFARKLGDKYGKKLTNIATKTGIETAKTASKRAVKTKSKVKEDERQEIYIPPEKRQIDHLRLF